MDMTSPFSDRISTVSGHSLPPMGLGCYRAQGSEVIRAICWAVEAGYRFFDTASRYGNEAQVGEGLRRCGISREKIYLVTKLWPTQYQDPLGGLEDSLRALNCDYVDCYLLHWPGTDRSLRLHAYEALLNARERGLCRGIGVSNFLPAHLRELIEVFGEAPVMDQVELNPWYPQNETAAFCRDHNIAVCAWGPILRGHLGEVPLLLQMAERRGRTPAQIVLRWHLQKGSVPIPKSTDRGRIFENADLFHFSLSDEEMKKLDALENGRHFGRDPLIYNGEDVTV